jgi:hypothetical protein
VDSMTNREFGRYYSRKMFPAIHGPSIPPRWQEWLLISNNRESTT